MSGGIQEAEDDLVTACLREYASGRYSPPLVAPDQLEPGTLVADPSEDQQRLQYARGVVQNQGREVEVSRSGRRAPLEQSVSVG